MRVASLLAFCLTCLTLAGCVGVDDETGSADSLKPVLTNTANAEQAVTSTPLGMWSGGMTMLMMTTRDSAGPGSPWFGSKRAADPTAGRVVLYPPQKTLLASVNPLGSDAWTIAGVSAIKSNQPATSLAKQAEGRDVLIYIHGFNETFDSATTSYAKLVSGIQFGGVPVLFTWPSRGALLDYGTDRESAMWSRDTLEDTLMALASDEKVGRIHILAHSMGGLVTLEALRSIADRSSGALDNRFGAIILANPDVDVDLFRRQTKRLASLVPKMTVIMSAKDRALEFSSRLAGNVPRVGTSDRAELESTGVKVVDATDYGSGIINHDIFMSRVELHGVIARAIENASEGQ